MSKIKMGITAGALAGIIDMFLMVMQKITWEANFSAFIFWIVVGFLIATTQLKFRGAIKGVIISLSVLLPVAIIVGWQEPFSLIPMIITNLIFGALLGWFLDKK